MNDLVEALALVAAAGRDPAVAETPIYSVHFISGLARVTTNVDLVALARDEGLRKVSHHPAWGGREVREVHVEGADMLLAWRTTHFMDRYPEEIAKIGLSASVAYVVRDAPPAVVTRDWPR